MTVEDLDEIHEEPKTPLGRANYRKLSVIASQLRCGVKRAERIIYALDAAKRDRQVEHKSSRRR